MLLPPRPTLTITMHTIMSTITIPTTTRTIIMRRMLFIISRMAVVATPIISEAACIIAWIMHHIRRRPHTRQVRPRNNRWVNVKNFEEEIPTQCELPLLNLWSSFFRRKPSKLLWTSWTRSYRRWNPSRNYSRNSRNDSVNCSASWLKTISCWATLSNWFSNMWVAFAIWLHVTTSINISILSMFLVYKRAEFPIHRSSSVCALRQSRSLTQQHVP